MNRETKEGLASLIIGLGISLFAAKKGEESPEGSMAEVKDRKPKSKSKKKPATSQAYEQWLNRKRQGKDEEKQEPNPQRYNVFLDVIERYTQPQLADWREMMIMMPAPRGALNPGQPGQHAGHVRDHQQICQINENDGKWSAMITGGEMSLQEKVTMRDLSDMIANGQYNLNSFAVVLIAIPTHATSLEDQLAGAKWHIFGEYASYGDAARNSYSIIGDVIASCRDANHPFNKLLDED